MTRQNENQDQVKLDKGFEIKCLNCGSIQCRLYVDATGCDSCGDCGEIHIECKECGQDESR